MSDKPYNYMEGTIKQSNAKAKQETRFMKVGETIEYRDYRITFDYPPIPVRTIDYSFAHKDYDLDDPRYGSAGSIQDCKDQIDEMIEDEE